MSLGVILHPGHVPSWSTGKQMFAPIVCVDISHQYWISEMEHEASDIFKA